MIEFKWNYSKNKTKCNSTKSMKLEISLNMAQLNLSQIYCSMTSALPIDFIYYVAFTFIMLQK